MRERPSIGARRWLFTLEAPADTADDIGGVSRAYVANATIRARLTDISVAPGFRNDQQGQIVTHEIAFRARDGLSAEMRFRLGDRIFQIIGVEAIDEKGLFVRALCEEVRP
jgi:SPP1 family predicted phage head-tail adaptor